MILYGLPVSTYSAKVRIALLAKGIAFEEREPPGGSYRSEAYRAIVPMGTLPALDEDGFVLSESEAILEYLEETRPGPALLPREPRRRARSRFLSRFHDLYLEPPVRSLFPHVNPARRDPGFAGEKWKEVDRRLGQLEALVEPAPFAMGAALTLADCGYAVTFPLMQLLAQAMDQPFALPSRLAAWNQALQDSEPVRKALAAWRPATERWLAAQRGAKV